MATKVDELRDHAKTIARHPRTRKIAIWFVSIVVAIGVLGALVAPLLLRGKLASALSEKLHREVSIEQIRINPYAMTATVRGFLMKERASTATAVSFDELYVNLQLSSLFRLAPVIKELHLVKPYINLVRNSDFKYNYQDIIDDLMAGPSGPTPRFSLNNIQLIDGKIDFDDRPEQTKHTISAIRMSVPFISSIPSYVDIKVQPAFYALVNGAPLQIGGETMPFKDSHDSVVHLDLKNVEIPKYLEYSPVELKFKAPSGQLNGRITASFKNSADKPAILNIAGNLDLKDLVAQELDGKPLINLPSLEVAIDAIEVFAKKARVKALKVQGLELHVTHNRDGTVNLASLAPVNSKDAAATQKPEASKPVAPFSYLIDDILLESGKLYISDEAPTKPYRTQLENLRLHVTGLTNEPDKQADVELSFSSDAKESFSNTGKVQLTPLKAEGKIQVEKLQLARLYPYYQDTVNLEVKDGLLDLTTDFSLEQKGEELQTGLSGLNAALSSLRLNVPGQAEPLWRIPLLSLKDTSVDVGKKTVVIGAFEGREGKGFVSRDADGTINYARLIKAQTAPQQAAPARDDAPWRVDMKRLALDRFEIRYDDNTVKTPAKLIFSEFSARGENFSNVKNNRAKVTISSKINNKGYLRLVGTAGTNPIGGAFSVDAKDIEVLPFQPYIEDQVNFLLTGGRVGTKGKLIFGKNGEEPVKVGYDGDLQVDDFSTVETDGAQDLLKWKSLNLAGIQFALEPMQLRINEINLADFYSRLILGADGKINLQKLMPQKPEKKDAAETKAEKPPETPIAQPASEKRITIGKINLQGGNVNFSDFYIKPNYSANLTGFQGTISELKPETPGDVEIHAKLDNAAPVDIIGKINPLSKDLYLDIKVDATDIDLSPMSPYSGRYVGYGIEKGKLTFNVQYKIENRKLEAQNKIILNQLTFGDKVESPDATKLPVLLAVALLKDRNGVMDINLPIGGSLDDPQFSIGGIVWQIIVNILVKAVTSPFALLGAAFGGGGGEELSYIEFDYGHATLTQTAETRIKTIASAMNNRPALKLEISGRVDPVNDIEGLKRASIERKMKAQKLRELVRQGSAPKSVDDVQIDKAEYERYLKAAYSDESFPKPRNFIGMAQDLPVPEMEGLMLKYATATDDDMRELANRRAQAVRDRLLATNQVTADRLFIVAAKPLTKEEQDKVKAKSSRVDFTLK
jgi:uncharacterized protein involved in outer membrane biogenesis